MSEQKRVESSEKEVDMNNPNNWEIPQLENGLKGLQGTRESLLEKINREKDPSYEFNYVVLHAKLKEVEAAIRFVEDIIESKK